MPPSAQGRDARRTRVIAGFRARNLDQVTADAELMSDLRAEAACADPDKLICGDLLLLANWARRLQEGPPALGLFFSTDDVILVPGVMASELIDVKSDGGVVWVHPLAASDDESAGRTLLSLGLGKYGPGEPDQDASEDVRIMPNGALPVIYSALKFDLDARRYTVQIFGYDWRKSIEESAAVLAGLIRDRLTRPFRPLHIIAHSQGAMVARRSLQLVGTRLARELVSNLVLIAPVTAGTFSIVRALFGDSSLVETIRRFGVTPPRGFSGVLQSMTGVYQLIPYRPESACVPNEADGALSWLDRHGDALADQSFWPKGTDPKRLRCNRGWARRIDTSFLNDRTTIILGNRLTVGGLVNLSGVAVADPAFDTSGDGTVPDSLALIPGVQRVYRARGAGHMVLPSTLSVITAVRDTLAGREVKTEANAGRACHDKSQQQHGLSDRSTPGIPFLAEHRDVPLPTRPVSVMLRPTGSDSKQRPPLAGPAGAEHSAPSRADTRPSSSAWEAWSVPPAAMRKLRVFSFDPLYATELESLGAEQLTIELPWDFADGNRLEPGPVGEFVEVVDYDPASGCFYPPVDLNHPNVLAQGGLPVSEGDPRFHQQMAYAVSMETIWRFELSLGRVALWAPRNRGETTGKAPSNERIEDQFVRRLRIYPHAVREANAYYDPDRVALLLGYFPIEGPDVGGNLPGGMAFASLSYDIITHETTHALLDGLHRYLMEPSNPHVLAFHEAIADAVAVFQHFSHPEVLTRQIRSTQGNLERESMLGVLARQFGEAMHQRGALRQYLGEKKDGGRWEPIKPDSQAIRREKEPHGLGAILVAALFRAFVKIYNNRVADLRRIATGGTGVLPVGEISQDLGNRMAAEASKAARHMLTMCIRALDYIPPFDLTFGEYLRALVTADYDLVRNDDLQYRVSIISAFRDWGIYPGDVRSLSVGSLLWSPPEVQAFDTPLRWSPADKLHEDPLFNPDAVLGHNDAWGTNRDRLRCFINMHKRGRQLQDWITEFIDPGAAPYMGIDLDSSPNAPPNRSIERDSQGRPCFEVNSPRLCRRIGPDQQERADLVVEIVQKRKAFFDPERQDDLDNGRQDWSGARQDFFFLGGCTLVIDQETGDVRYCVRKSIHQQDRLEAERQYRRSQPHASPGNSLVDCPTVNPFRLLHVE